MHLSAWHHYGETPLARIYLKVPASGIGLFSSRRSVFELCRPTNTVTSVVFNIAPSTCRLLPGRASPSIWVWRRDPSHEWSSYARLGIPGLDECRIFRSPRLSRPLPGIGLSNTPRGNMHGTAWCEKTQCLISGRKEIDRRTPTRWPTDCFAN